MPNEMQKTDPPSSDIASITGGLIEATAGGGDAAKLFFGGLATDAVSNFPPGALEEWRLSAIATGECLGRKEAVAAGQIAVEYIYCHKVMVESIVGGELVEAIRTVLITPEAVAYSFVSNGIAASASKLLLLLRSKSIVPPVNVRVVDTETRKGRRVLSLVPA